MTKTQKALLIGIPVLAGAYIIYRQFRGRRTYEQAVLDNPPGAPTGTTGTGSTDGGYTGGQGGRFKRYKVTTLATPLNVRQSPTTSSAKIGSLPKGSIIWACASQTSGWMIYSEDGANESGYVSADYLTAI